MNISGNRIKKRYTYFLIVLLSFMNINKSVSQDNHFAFPTYREDFNGDGKTDIADVISLLLEGSTNPGNSRVDFNGNGSFEIDDAIGLLMNITRNQLTPVGWNISGKILPNNGNVISLYRTSVHISGLDTDTLLTTKTNGSYNLSDVKDGTYIVSPGRNGYIFSPDTIYLKVDGNDKKILDIYATRDSSDTWGSVRVSKDKQGGWNVYFDNSEIFVHYGTGNNSEGYIKDFNVKAKNANLHGNIIDAAAHRSRITNARIINNSSIKKTVRVTWIGNELFPYPAVSDISIFPDSKYLRIDYIECAFAHIAEWGYGEWGTYKIYGYDIADPPLYEKCFYWENSNYGCEGEYVNWKGIEGDPSSLLYKGWFILGVYDSKGVGYGRVLKGEDIHTIKLLSKTGFEIFIKNLPTTSYLFTVTQGADEVISIGKMLVDNHVD